MRKRSGGWNNTTYFVENSTRRAVLRIYDTHKDREKIEFEHAVLQKLGMLSLPFKVPVPIGTILPEKLWFSWRTGLVNLAACSNT